MRSPYPTGILTLLVIFLVVVRSNGQEIQPMLGESAPGFTLVAMDGGTYSLEDTRGKYVVVHFAATWCPFCNAEAPNLEQLYRDYRDRGVQVFIIDVMESQDVVSKLVDRFKFSFPVLLDTNGSVSASYAPEGVQPALERHEVPIAANLIIDKEGRIRYYSLLNSAAFDAKLTGLKEKLNELIESAGP